MKFNPPLQAGRLIRRYKRFLADIQSEQGDITIHCPNTGAMTGCADQGNAVYYSTSDNPKRKYPNTWELSQNAQDQWFCINTTLANHIVKQAIEQTNSENDGKQNVIVELSGYHTIRSEVKYGDENSRIDLLLQDDNKPDCYIEIKSVTLKSEQSSQGYFPDAKSLRGQKHLRELSAMAKSGKRAILFFLIQHTGIEKVSPARHIDPTYGELLDEAIQSGVEVLCYGTAINQHEITINRVVEFCSK